MAVTRFVGALAGFLALSVGGPWGLVSAARWRFGGASPFRGVPSPREWTWMEIWSALEGRLTESTVTDVVVRAGLVVGWVAVVVVVGSVVAEMIHLVRYDGIGVPDVRLLGPSQRLGRIIASGLLVIVPVIGSGRTLALDSVSLTPMETPIPRTSTVTEAAPVLRPAVGVVESAEVAERSTPAGPTMYVVVRGDSIFSIAERLAGPDPKAVVEYADRILERNLGRTMPDGQVFVNAAFIDVGWELELPGKPGEVGDVVEPPAAVAAAHTVVPGDSLWSIADEHLGAGDRWSEIFDQNRDRSFDDGRTLHDPALIVPGWDLHIPSVAGAESVDGAGSVDRAESDGRAESASQVGREMTELPVPVSTAPVSTVVEVPAPIAPAPVEDESATSTTSTTSLPTSTTSLPTSVPVTSSPAVAPEQPNSQPNTHRNAWIDEPGQPAVELLTVGRAAMVSAGVLALVASRRRRRLRESVPGAVAARPPEPIIRLERQLRTVDIGDRMMRIDLGVRAAAPSLVAGGARVVAVLVDQAGGLELVASEVVPPADPWVVGGAPMHWRLPPSVPTEDLAVLARQVGAPCPTLVQIAVTDDGRDLYVDLEALGTLSIDAPADAVAAVVSAISAALAASPFAETVVLFDVGVGDDAFLGHRFHRPMPDVVSALREAEAVIAVSSITDRSTFELRSLAAGGDAWEPAVVLVGNDDVVPAVDRPGLSVVAGAIDGPGARLLADGAGWRFEPLGVRCVPVGLPAGDARMLAALVRASDAPLDMSLDDSTLPPQEEPVSALVRQSLAVGAPPAILVRLLGPVSVRSADGRVADFDRQKSKELVVWLATHRERSTRTAARTALWDLDVRDATFANVVSDARRTLARLVPPPEGDEWVGRTLGEDLPLHSTVRTDADLVRDALAIARSAGHEAAIPVLRDAVGLIVGMPFEGTDFLWPEAEGIASELVLLATSAATRLAECCLAIGDVDGVFEATARGLQVLPGHEAMVGLRMRAHGSRGDRAGVRREWAQYERVTHADPWSDGEPSALLAGLRRELLGS